MPIVLIIIGLAVAIGLGGYFLRTEEIVTPAELTESSTTPEVTDGTTVPAEEGDDAASGTNVPPEEGDSPTSTTPVAATPTTPTIPSTPAATATPVTAYANGAHTANITYRAPENSNHTMAVTLTLKGDVVTASSIVFGGDRVGESSQYQSRFMKAYQPLVVGKKLSEIKLSRVGGASLTTGGFNDAIAKVKATAAN